MHDLPRKQRVRIVLPLGVARQLCSRAQREWGADAEVVLDGRRTQVFFYLGGRSQFRGQRNARPVGDLILRWEVPTDTSATIERIGWDPNQGSTLQEALQVVDALVGWPAATRWIGSPESTAHAAG